MLFLHYQRIAPGRSRSISLVDWPQSQANTRATRRPGRLLPALHTHPTRPRRHPLLLYWSRVLPRSSPLVALAPVAAPARPPPSSCLPAQTLLPGTALTDAVEDGAPKAQAKKANIDSFVVRLADMTRTSRVGVWWRDRDRVR